MHSQTYYSRVFRVSITTSRLSNIGKKCMTTFRKLDRLKIRIKASHYKGEEKGYFKLFHLVKSLHCTKYY